MDLLQSIILGAIQGITEFFPVSSTAHLVLLPWFFSWVDKGLPFNVALHVGSLLAIIYYFWREWILIIKEFLQSISEWSFEGRPNGKTGLYLIIATIPGGLAGVLFEKYAAGVLRHPLSVAFTLSFFGVVLYFADRYSKKTKNGWGNEYNRLHNYWSLSGFCHYPRCISFWNNDFQEQCLET